MEIKQNKFIQFIKDNDIKTNSQCYILSKVLCNKDSKDPNKNPYVWFKLLQIKSVNVNGEDKHQMFVLDYFCRDVQKAVPFHVGQLVSYRLSDYIGKKCSIVEINAVD